MKVKDLKQGDFFTKKAIADPKDSQVWIRGAYDRSQKKSTSARVLTTQTAFATWPDRRKSSQILCFEVDGMKNYTIDIFRVTRKGREHEIRIELPRERFTAREYKGILLPTLFDLACEGRSHKHLDAVIQCDGVKVLTVRCDTEAEGSEITAHFVAARPREVSDLCGR